MLLRRCALLRTAARRTTTASTTAAPLSSAVGAIPGADHKYVIKSPAPPLELPPPGQLPNFTDFMTKGFAANGDKPAVVVENPDGSVDVRTYADLLADVESVAHELRTQMNFQAGDTALLVSPNHADYFTAVHSVLKLNGVLSPANPLYSPHEIGNQLKDCGAKVVMSHPFCLEKVMEAVAASGRAEEVRVVVVGADAPAGSGATPFAALKGTGASVGSLGPVSDEQLAVLPYSSGTTGLPKGTMLTHRNLVANVLQFEYVDGRFWEKGNETLMSPLPFFHIYGFTASLNITLFYNSTLVTMPAFDLEKFLGVVQDRKCTKAHLVPPIILGLAKHPLVDKYDLSSMQCIVSGAAPLGSEVAQACAARLGCIVKQAWGMSELAPIGSVNPDDDNREGSSGCTVASMLYKIVDTETGALLPPGEEGEVVCTGPNVMTGYLNNPEANATAFDEDGWFKTGDIGFVDGDGWITFTDRLKELIKYKGFQVPPAELEALLLTHPQIVDAAVIPVLDDAAGEVPRAFVTLAPAAADEFDAEAIAAWVAERVAPHKKLRGGVVQMVAPDVIPKSASGKILRRVLVQRNKDGEFDK
jgi:acyl-CoA synthetase (AMP-forming)/AMP-acid ligase II